MVLADEPTGNLDRDSTHMVGDVLRRLPAEHGCTVVLVTHDRELAGRADRCLLLDDGRLTPEQRSPPEYDIVTTAAPVERMTWRDAALLAGRSVRRRPGRTSLTVLAVALASALLTALLTIAGTAETRVLDELAKGGPLAGIRVAAAEPDPGQIDRDDARPGPAKSLDDAALARIRGVPNVRTVVPVVSARLLVIHRPIDGPTARRSTRGSSARAVGVDLRRASSLPITVVAGRLPAPNCSERGRGLAQPGWSDCDITRTNAERVLGSEVADGRRAVFIERGRVDRARALGPAAGRRSRRSGSGRRRAPAADPAGPPSPGSGPSTGIDQGADLGVDRSPYNGAFVVARGIDNVGTVRAGITAVGYSTSAPENLIASVRRYLRVVEIVLTAVGPSPW